jgi:K+-transporting ATPase ATPase A chain
MTARSGLQLMLYLVVLAVTAWPLGVYMARVYDGRIAFLAPIERLIYRLAGVRPANEMNWRQYAAALLAFNGMGMLLLYALQRWQGWLPLNPAGLGAVPPDTAFNTAASFVSNTNWQSYTGESTMSYLTQMVGLTTQNFLSAATGMAVLVALVRGFVRRTAETIGSFWVDVVRTVLYILLPLSLGVALLLVGDGVVQTLDGPQAASLLDPDKDVDGQFVINQVLPRGPVASQVAIKQLGANGGGFFGVNSAHPYENPTPFTGFVEMLSILLIPAALCITFGRMVGDPRQGRALLAVMLLIFIPVLSLTLLAEQGGNPVLAGLGIDQTASSEQPGGNMEGKEVRFGIVDSALWATATTAASNGSVNSMHDSYMPLGGLGLLWLMQVGEVIFGGVGSGLYGMLVFAIIAVFVAGLMVGRTPEYLGKKIEAFEMKMATLAVLIPVVVVLLGTALALSVPAARASLQDGGAHGFSEVLYAFSSAGNNNGSAFAGLNANTPFYNTALGIAMLIARYWVAIPVLAIAGSLAGKKALPASSGTLPTHSPLFVVWLAAVVVMVGALSFLPALALGPIVEHMMLFG